MCPYPIKFCNSCTKNRSHIRSHQQSPAVTIKNPHTPSSPSSNCDPSDILARDVAGIPINYYKRQRLLQSIPLQIWSNLTILKVFLKKFHAVADHVANRHTEAGAEPEVKVEEDVTAPGLDVDDQNLMHALTSAIPEQLVPGATGNLTADAGHFELDETTMRSLQQFMESHGLHTEARSTEQVSTTS